MFVSMNIINLSNETSSHFDCENVTETAPSIIDEKTIQSGKFENKINGVREKNRRKRKTRRFKSRFKGKNESCKKSKYGFKKMRSRIYPQSEAPYNTNQFLMADHNNVENLDDKLAYPSNYITNERTRVRESSFTSVDSEDGPFYSSPEDEDEFFTKDFDNTYQLVCAEKFGNLSKAQLTKIIFELEAKVEELSKKIVNSSKLDETSKILLEESGDNKELRIGIKDIFLENERLKAENEELKQFIKDNAVTTTSSSSSSSTDNSNSSSSEEENSGNGNISLVQNQKSLDMVDETT